MAKCLSSTEMTTLLAKNVSDITIGDINDLLRMLDSVPAVEAPDYLRATEKTLSQIFA